MIVTQVHILFEIARFVYSLYEISLFLTSVWESWVVWVSIEG